MPDTDRRYQVEEVLALPRDGRRYEVVAGELLVTPAPAPLHQLVLTRLVAALSGYFAAHPELGTVYVGPGDVFLGEEDYVQPDLLVVPPGEVAKSWRELHRLLLAVEVVSPESSFADRVVKRRLYQRHGVASYWVVDPDARLVEVWQPHDDRPVIVTNELRWRVAPQAGELAIGLSGLFDRPHRTGA
jgi:Uma2 family endonuclease